MTNPYQPPMASTVSTTADNSHRSLRWLYTLLILVIGISGLIVPFEATTVRLAASELIVLLTYPLGGIGTICAMVLIYSGISTPGEAYFLAAPVFAIAGYIQWYVLLPRLIRRGHITALGPKSVQASKEY